MADDRMVKFVVGGDMVGRRLDAVLAECEIFDSRAEAQRLIDAGEVPPSVRTQGIDVWLMARGGGSDACAQLIAGWATR